jgi:glycerol-3-phosphate O-acyltransferase
MSILFGLNAPEFFDKNLFRHFITALQNNNVISTNEHGVIYYDDSLDKVAKDARLVLSVEKQQVIENVTRMGI